MTDAEFKELLEGDCWAFAQYVLPHFMFGDIHKKILREMGDPERHKESPNRLFLIPRDHLKSVCLATYACWRIARNPAYTILYITADEDLGRLQMSFMQNIFDSDQFRTLWPDHFEPEKGRRAKWTSLSIIADHPIREQLNIRDETIAVKTIKSGKVGRHPDEILYDDLVTPENAYTELGRKDVREGASAAVSLAKSNGLMTAVGTVYHPADQYSIWQDSTYHDYSADGEFLGEKPLWKTRLERVENAGSGTGTYLWPRVFSPELKEWFGWDIKTIMKKKAEYVSNGQGVHFYAQYYMETNDPSSHRLNQDNFQYINPRYLKPNGGQWEYSGKRLTIMAFMDVATTDAANKLAKKADYTAIAVVAIDTEGFYYVLALEQFQTDKRSVYYDQILELWKRWGFKRIYIEMENAGKIVADGIRESLRRDGYSLIVDGKSPPRGVTKFERHASITIPRYEQNIVYHTKGGWTHELEDQLIKERPAHDDLLDVMTMAIETLKKPQGAGLMIRHSNEDRVIIANDRFGGRA